MKWPNEFVERTSNLLGTEYEAFEQALSQEASISIRHNETKSNTTPANSIPWCKAGEYLSKRPSFTLDPLFHAGAYYVQEPSSMFLSQAIKQYTNNAVAYLDLCAAPGGKTTLALQHLPKGSLVVANEIVRSRAHILAENVIKWGNPYHVVLNQTPKQIGELRSFFDIVAADVPCSGEGMFRKDSEAVEHWSIENVQLCANRQREIVEDIWPSLKPGGVFIYSTCTFNQEENEENIRWMIEELGAESLPIAHDFPQILSSSDKELHLYRFLPHRTKGEGFSIAVLRKPDTENEVPITLTSKKGRNKEKKGVVPTKFPEEAKQWIHQPEGFQFFVRDNRLNAIPEEWVNHVETLRSLFPPLSMGIELGEIKGRDLIPAHGLAMSNMLNRTAFPIVKLEEEQALDFLRKETINLPEQTPRGFVLCLYKETPIGWVKNIGSRSNNLYPQEWRIRLRKN